MENNSKFEIAPRGIFDISDWSGIYNLRNFQKQINLASAIQFKIDAFKQNFIRSKLYTYRQLLENDDVCWLLYRYVQPGLINRPKYISKYNKPDSYIKGLRELYKPLSGNVIVGTKLGMWLMFYKYCHSNIEPILDNSIGMSSTIHKFLEDYIITNTPTDYYKYCFSDVLRRFHGFEIIKPSNKMKVVIPSKYSPEVLDINTYYIDCQTTIIDQLGKFSFIESQKNKYKDSINKLRALEYKNYTKYHKKYKYKDIDTPRFILNKYNQPVEVIRSEDISTSIITAKNNVLELYLQFRYSFINNTLNKGNIQKLVYDLDTSKFLGLYIIYSNSDMNNNIINIEDNKWTKII